MSPAMIGVLLIIVVPFLLSLFGQGSVAKMFAWSRAFWRCCLAWRIWRRASLVVGTMVAAVSVRERIRHRLTA